MLLKQVKNRVKDDITFGDYFRDYRKSRGIATTAAFNGAASTVSRFESGTSSISFQRFNEYMTALNLDIADFFASNPSFQIPFNECVEKLKLAPINSMKDNQAILDRYLLLSKDRTYALYFTEKSLLLENVDEYAKVINQVMSILKSNGSWLEYDYNLFWIIVDKLSLLQLLCVVREMDLQFINSKYKKAYGGLYAECMTKALLRLLELGVPLSKIAKYVDEIDELFLDVFSNQDSLVIKFMIGMYECLRIGDFVLLNEVFAACDILLLTELKDELTQKKMKIFDKWGIDVDGRHNQ